MSRVSYKSLKVSENLTDIAVLPTLSAVRPYAGESFKCAKSFDYQVKGCISKSEFVFFYFFFLFC